MNGEPVTSARSQLPDRLMGETDGIPHRHKSAHTRGIDGVGCDPQFWNNRGANWCRLRRQVCHSCAVSGDS